MILVQLPMHSAIFWRRALAHRCCSGRFKHRVGIGRAHQGELLGRKPLIEGPLQGWGERHLPGCGDF